MHNALLPPAVSLRGVARVAGRVDSGLTWTALQYSWQHVDKASRHLSSSALLLARKAMADWLYNSNESENSFSVSLLTVRLNFSSKMQPSSSCCAQWCGNIHLHT
jgi:hypothetical protein